MNKTFLILLIIINVNLSKAQLVDIDGNVYLTKLIEASYDSARIWSTSNLNVSKFKNGESIMEAKTATEWEYALNNGIPAWCYYENNPQLGKEYGKLYNYYAVTSLKGLAPEDWHIANEEDWQILFSSLKINITEVNVWKDEKILLSTTFETPFGRDGNNKSNYGNNKSGLNIKPSGYCRGGDQCYDLGSYTYIWLIKDLRNIPFKMFGNHHIDAFYFKDEFRGGGSVRCVKD